MNQEKSSIKIKNAINQLQNDYLKLDTYPTLCSKIKDNTLDMDIIDHMLSNLDKMHDGQQTEHQASVDVGTLLRDKIVIPDMKRRGMSVNTTSDITNLSEEEAKKKVDEMFQL